MDERARGEVSIRSGKQQETVLISTFRPQNVKTEDLKGLFVEQNGYVSIPAADFHRKSEDAAVQIQVIEGLGIENKSIQFGEPRKRILDPNASFKASVDYDFFTFSSGWITVYIYALPVFPLNSFEKAKYEFRIDDGMFYRPEIEAGEYSEEWKGNVLRNFTVNTIRYYLPTAGKHTLKLNGKTQGIVIQKIIMDTGGLKDSYLGPGSSKVE